MIFESKMRMFSFGDAEENFQRLRVLLKKQFASNFLKLLGSTSFARKPAEIRNSKFEVG